MSRSRDILASIFISFEFLIALVAALSYSVCSARIGVAAAHLGSNAEKIQWLALIPVALLGLMIASTKDLLFPEGPNSTLLHEWPNYSMVKDRFVLSLVWGGLCSVLSVGIWVFATIPFSPLTFTVFAVSIVLSAITFAHYHLATVEIRSILNAHKP